MRPSVVILCAALFLSIGTAAADDAFHPVPAAPDQVGSLELRVVSYGNGIHGEMEVELRNPGDAPAVFFASGLYFVPDDDGGEAPQRLGIVGGIRAGVEGAPRRAVEVAAGATRKVRFDVYCVDRWRHGPGSATTYSLAPARMPTKLLAAIDASTAPLLTGHVGAADDRLQQQIQDLVWSMRRAVRVRLAGER